MEQSANRIILQHMKINHRPAFLIVVGILALLFLSGCATRYDVHLDALSTSGPPAAGSSQTYRLASNTPEVETTDLFFKEVARHVEPVLQAAGYRSAPEGVRPDLQIAIKAHLSDPLVETREYSDPIYYDSPGYLQTVRVPIVSKDGKIVRFAYHQYWSGPRTRFAGYVDRDRQITVYDKILKLSTRRLNENGLPVDEVWSITIRLRSQSTDYRSALPAMMVAAEPYIGRRTDGEITVTVSEDSEDLEAFRNRIRDGG